ncbi:MAG: hypothetical protein PVJ36_01355 [Nitrospirota bacterium]|jgi:hypothetical protein
MNLKEHENDIKNLLKEYCLFLVEPVYVDNVAEWSKKSGFDEPDREKPLKLVVSEEKGCKLVMNEEVPDRVIEDRLKAMSVRDALQNVAEDREARLDSEKKKVAYLFLSEYGSHMPEHEDDELLIDNWAFKEMERLGYFNE